MLETKVCKNCGVEKSIDEFRINKGYHLNKCKKCEYEYQKQYRKTNTEFIKKDKERKKIYYFEHKDKITEYNKKYKEEHKEELKIKTKLYRARNRDIILEKDKINSKKYRENHKEYFKEYNKKYYSKNKNILLKKQYIYKKEKMNTDDIFKFKENIRKSIRESFRRKKMLKKLTTEKILGCDINMLIEHLIKTYENNYNEKWNWNYLKNVHIDHIIPLFKTNNEKEIIKLCHYTNLQLLKKEDNLSKKDKLDWKLEV